MSVLKPKHSLVGKSLVPVILKFKAQVERIEECDLNRLKKGHALTRYNLDELRTDGAVASSCSAATASTTCSSSVSTASVSQASGDKNMETRLRDIERKMESMKEKSGEDQLRIEKLQMW
uniref:Uncharacterized protein n=1 Tax=Magallana gigas TaxID=29159 RepID=A0A8W8MT24_MAGGI